MGPHCPLSQIQPKRCCLTWRSNPFQETAKVDNSTKGRSKKTMKNTRLRNNSAQLKLCQSKKICCKIYRCAWQLLRAPNLWFDSQRWPVHQLATWSPSSPDGQVGTTTSPVSMPCFASWAFWTQRLRAESPAVFASETDLKKSRNFQTGKCTLSSNLIFKLKQKFEKFNLFSFKFPNSLETSAPAQRRTLGPVLRETRGVSQESFAASDTHLTLGLLVRLDDPGRCWRRMDMILLEDHLETNCKEVMKLEVCWSLLKSWFS